MASTTTDRRDGVNTSKAVKVSCRALSTTNLTLAGEQTVDGVALVTGDRAAAAGQTSSVDNGIYRVDTGAWTREPDFDGSNDVGEGTLVKVNHGTSNSGFWYVTSTGTINPGTDAITFGQASTVLAVISAFMQTMLDDTTAAQARGTLGSSTVGDALFIAASAAAARSTLGALADAANAVTAKHLAGSDCGFVAMINGTIAASRAGNAETIAIKTLAGADPSAADPVIFIFRNAAAATGDYVFLQATAALSVTVSSGSTLGASNATPFRIWLTAFNDASTLRLGVVNCLSGTSIMALKDDDLRSSTAEGGAGAADSAQVIYTGAAVTGKAMRVLGFLEYTLTTAGTWVTAPSKTQLFGPGVPLPGTVVQEQYNQTGAVATGSTTMPNDDTIPQLTEGDQYMSQAITPTAAANVLDWQHHGHYATSAGAGNPMQVALFQDSTANALASACMGVPTITACAIPLRHRMVAGTTSSTTGKIRAGLQAAGTTTFNGFSGGRMHGGVMASSLGVKEIMA